MEIEPYVGAGPVRLGTTIEQVRQSVGAEVTTFKKAPTDEMGTDAFDSVGLHVYYKPPGVCEALELMAPADPTFRGRKLLGQPFSQMLKWFRQLDPAVEVDDAGLTSREFGIALYASAAKKRPSLPVEGVLVFERGYY